MAVRNFAADNSELRVPVIAASNLTGALTFAALVKRNTTGTWQSMIAAADSAAAWQYEFGFAGSTVTNALVFGTPSTGTVYGTTTITSTSTWYVVAYTRPSGTGSGRFHLFPLGGAWVHELGLLGTPSSPGSQSGGSIRFGENIDVDDLNARMVLAAVWNSELSDAQIEALATGLATSAWTGHAVPPSGVWQFNQATATTDVPDLMAAHATITGTITGTTDTNGIAGTTIVTTDDPPGWTFAGAGSNVLAGLVASSSTVAGTLAVRAPLAGTVASSSTLAGTLAVRAALAGVAASASTVTGTLAITKPLAGTVASTSAASGALSVAAPLAGTVASATTVAGALAVTAGLAGTVTSASTASGSLLVAKPLAGTVASSSTVAGTLTNTAPGGNALAGTVVSTSTAAGTLTVTASLTGTVASVSTTTGDLTAQAALAGTVASTSTTAGALAVTANLAGVVASASTVTGTLTNTAAGSNALAGTITSTSTVSGALLVSKPLGGTVASASVVTGTLTSGVALSGTVASTSTLTGVLAVSHPLAGSVTSTSTVTGAVVVLRPLTGEVIVLSSVFGTLTNRGPVTAVGRLEAGASVAFGESAGSSSVYESTSGVLALSE